MKTVNQTLIQKIGNSLVTLDEAISLVLSGRKLSFAAEESLLSQLPLGNWVGGTTPYFMTAEKGVFSKEKLFVHDFSESIIDFKIVAYDCDTISHVTIDQFGNGFTNLLIPAFSEIHQKYANEAPQFSNLYNNPLIGWIVGVNLSELATKKPCVFDGSTGRKYTDKAIAMHVELAKSLVARMEIVNIFTQDKNADVLVFDKTGFEVESVRVNGFKVNFSKYLESRKIDTKLPLVSDYSGAMINTSFCKVENEIVSFYAPVFKGLEYRIAKPVDDYSKAFSEKLPKVDDLIFSCNCILNYLYGELEGKSVGFSGPITFGEIGYQLLNQTLTYLVIDDMNNYEA